MEQFLLTWGTAIGIFVVTGLFMKAMNTTIGAKPGDKGIKGVWYVWKRFFLLPIGAGFGALIPMLGMSTPFGDGIGNGILAGILAAFVAGQSYDMIVGSWKARTRHVLAKNGDDKK